MNVLIAWDAHPNALPMLDWVRAWNRLLQHPAHVTLLHVVPIAPDGAFGVLDQAVAQDLEEAKQALRQVLPDGGSPVECKILAGAPGPLICEEAVGHDLVILGSHGRTQMGELLWGTTGAYVLHHAPCAVLVVRPDARPPIGA